MKGSECFLSIPLAYVLLSYAIILVLLGSNLEFSNTEMIKNSLHIC